MAASALTPGTTPLTAVLGSTSGRYFSSGYRRVRYGVWDVRPDPRVDGRTHATVTAQYPLDWSLGADGTARTPHLSSADAIALPLQVLERIVDPASLSAYRVSRVELRAPRGPCTDLDEVPLVLDVHGSAGRTDLCIRADVGGMRTRLELSLSPDAARCPPAHAPDGSVYSQGFRDVLVDTVVTHGPAHDGPAHDGVVATHTFELDPDRPVVRLTGVESGFSPAVSAIDLLVVMGQMTQAAIYLSMPADRSRGDLWMRSMAIDITRPPAAVPCVLHSTTRLTRDKVVDRAGRRIHDLVAESSINPSVQARASLAYVEPTAPEGEEVPTP